QIYKELFEPSEVLSEPYVIIGLNVIVADTDEEAEYLASSMAQVMVSITRGKMQPVQPPTDKLDQVLTPRELEMAKQRINSSMIGSESTVKQKIKDFIDYYGDIDEIMGVSYIFDQQKQHESYQKFKHIIDTL
ncbi:MAG: LLM class flavin-dependent oxidoreductase, partial [Staphylococcus warneri]|nr:LLM class flavin-dependent oxidoreductase [Staphylococcus warneri]